MTASYQPKYDWRRTQLDANDPPTDFDWIGYDGDGAVGRVRKEMHGPTKGKWHWAGWYQELSRERHPHPTPAIPAHAAWRCRNAKSIGTSPLK